MSTEIPRWLFEKTFGWATEDDLRGLGIAPWPEDRPVKVWPDTLVRCKEAVDCSSRLH